MSSDPDARWIDVAGAHLHVTLVGSGPELLLLNGIGAHADMWEPLARRLRATRRLVMIDMPGSGSTPALRRPARMSALAMMVTEALDRLDLPRVDVLGYSWGGALAQQVAHDHPDRVRHLCLVSTTPGWVGRPPALRAALAMLGPARQSSGSAAQRWHESPPSSWGYVQQLYAITGWTSVPWLRRLRARTLILTADDDPLVPAANARLMKILLPNAEVRVAPSGGHLWLLEHADESAALIEKFLDSGELKAADT